MREKGRVLDTGSRSEPIIPHGEGTGRSEIQRLARHGTLSMVGLVGGALLQFAMVLIVTHGMATTAAGAFLEAVAVFMILTNCGDLGADDALLRTAAALKRKGDLRRMRGYAVWALGPVLAAGILSGVLLSVYAGDVAELVFSAGQQAEGATYLRVLAWFLAIASLLNVSLSGVRGLGSIRTYVGVQNLIVPALRLVGIWVPIAAGLGATTIGLAWSLPLVLGGTIALRALLRLSVAESTPARRSIPQVRLGRELWGFAAPRAIASAFGVTITYLDVLLVGALASTRAAAIYAAISRLYVVANYGLLALRTAVGPQFSELLAVGRFDRLQSVYELSTSWAILLCWPVYIVFLVYAPVAARVFGHDYAEGGTALAILSVAGLVNIGTGGVVLLLLMSGHSLLNLFNTGFGLALNVALNVLLIPRYSLDGAAIAWAVSIVFMNVVTAVEVRRLIGINPIGRGYLWVACASVVAFGVIGALMRVLAGATLGSLVISLAIGIPVYGAALWAARETLELGAVRDTLPGRRARRAAG
jgi:O-antigen/teichoic acid export membrane protein